MGSAPWELRKLAFCLASVGFSAVVGSGQSMVAANRPKGPLTGTFFAPVTGHIEFDKSLRMTLAGVGVKSYADVIKLHSALSKAALTENSVKSWAFLNVAGLTIGKPPEVQNPPSAQSPTVPSPIWKACEVDIDGNSLRQESDEFVMGQRVFLRTAQSDVLLAHRTPAGHVTHAPSGVLHDLKLDAGWLFTRSRLDFGIDWREVVSDSDRRFKCVGATGLSAMIFADKTRDRILAIAYGGDGQLSRFTLHLGDRRYTEPSEYYLPAVTCVFTRAPGREKPNSRPWNLRCYFIKEANLDGPIDPQRFTMPLKPGQSYFAIGDNGKVIDAVPIRRNVDDITKSSPSALAKVLRAPTTPPTSGGPGNVALATIVVTGLIIACFALVYKLRIAG